MHEKLLIFQKTYECVLWLYPIINRIPQSHRLVLGRAIEDRAISMTIAVIEANKRSGADRIAFQKQVSNDLDVVRILLRLAKDLRFVSVGQYSAGVDKINEIGRMLSAWMESSKRV
ncbi:MAG: diversity-generating retroelement protein Avd [Candidatus Moranbacteria bacterium]|nr:diversity-generating retroelement protein Avd [Candidatus Moranbacteria bacterium]